MNRRPDAVAWLPLLVGGPALGAIIAFHAPLGAWLSLPWVMVALAFGCAAARGRGAVLATVAWCLTLGIVLVGADLLSGPESDPKGLRPDVAALMAALCLVLVAVSLAGAWVHAGRTAQR